VKIDQKKKENTLPTACPKHRHKKSKRWRGRQLSRKDAEVRQRPREETRAAETSEGRNKTSYNLKGGVVEKENGNKKLGGPQEAELKQREDETLAREGR